MSFQIKRVFILGVREKTIRVYYPEPFDWDEKRQIIWQWTEGNYGCDCNRYLFFQRAMNDDESEDIDHNGRNYLVSHIELTNGECIRIDELPPIHHLNLQFNEVTNGT